MITLFLSSHRNFTIRPFLEIWPNKAADSIRLVPYEHLHRIRHIKPCIYIFSDIERITEEQKQSAIHLCSCISKVYPEDLILNHPGRALTRDRLLIKLWDEGINQHRSYYPGDQLAGIRFPVFIRKINDHYGPMTGLIQTRQELDYQLQEIQKHEKNNDQLIIIEFTDTRCNNQLYRKYSAFRIGDRIVPGHIIFSDNWVVKDAPPGTPASDEEITYHAENPHSDQLLQIFRLANIEYGRIDYGLLNGKIQVWEINTNPVLVGRREKYSPDVTRIKKALVENLADAFLFTNTRLEDVRSGTGVTSAGVTAYPRLTPYQRLDRLFNSLYL